VHARLPLYGAAPIFYLQGEAALRTPYAPAVEHKEI
jgi:hypothetical protein